MQLCADAVAEGSQRIEEATKYKQSSATTTAAAAAEAAAATTTVVKKFVSAKKSKAKKYFRQMGAGSKVKV